MIVKSLVAPTAIVFLALSVAGAQDVCRQEGNFEVPAVIGGTVGALIGASIGDGHGRTIATVAGGLLGGVLGNSLLPRRHMSTNPHPLVNILGEQRNQVIEAAVTGEIPNPRKAAPVGPQE